MFSIFLKKIVILPFLGISIAVIIGGSRIAFDEVEINVNAQHDASTLRIYCDNNTGLFVDNSVLLYLHPSATQAITRKTLFREINSLKLEFGGNDICIKNMIFKLNGRPCVVMDADYIFKNAYDLKNIKLNKSNDMLNTMKIGGSCSFNIQHRDLKGWRVDAFSIQGILKVLFFSVIPILIYFVYKWYNHIVAGVKWFDCYFENKKNSFKLLLFLSIVIAFILVMRFWPALVRAEFWAEDLTEIFKTANENGVNSIIMPVWGYQMLIPRITGYIATFFPVLFTPYIYAGVSFLIAVITLVLFSSKRYEHIFNSRFFRICLCLIFTLSPGTGEVFLNLANLTTVSSLLIVFMLFRKPLEYSVFEIILIAFLVFSSGQIFLFIPLGVILWAITKNKVVVLIGIFVLVVMALNYYGVTAASSKAVTSGLLSFNNINKIPVIIIDNVFVRLLYMPFLGADFTEFLMRRTAIYFYLPGIIFIAVMIFLFFKLEKDARKTVILFLISFLCAISTFAVIAIVRNFPITREHGNTYWAIRYSFLPGIFAILLWSFLLHNAVKKKTFRVFSVAMLMIVSAHNYSRWSIDVYARESLNWPKQAERIQKLIVSRDDRSLAREENVVVSAHPKWSATVVIRPK